MGIHGLLPLLKSIMNPIHIKELKDKNVAVDTYSWLHKGALCCSKELCKDEWTTNWRLGLAITFSLILIFIHGFLPFIVRDWDFSGHIDYCMHRVNLLRHYGVKPVLVFDGGLLPMKSDQEAKRLRARKENLERAIHHETSGNSTAAYECYQKAVDISPSIALELIEVLKQENVAYIVAPYEADAQMTFLSMNKHVEAVITEDSDLIPFGCSRIIFKMDKFGQGVEFLYSSLAKNKELNFTAFTRQMLLEMCILSGCDYLQSLQGMGIKRAYSLIQKFKSHEKVIKHLRYNGVSIPPLYEETFKKAIWTFQHQWVYDPVQENIVHLVELRCDFGIDLEFLGPPMSQSVAKGIAEGVLDPITKLPFQNAVIHPQDVPDRSYKVKEFQPQIQKKKLDLPAQKNVLTNYFCLASIQAKRSFKAPRVKSKPSESPEESSPDSPVLVMDLVGMAKEPVGCSINSCKRSMICQESSKSSIREPELFCVKEDGLNLPEDQITNHVRNEPPTLVEKTRVVKRKVIVRSTYFRHNLSKDKKGPAVKKHNIKREIEDDVSFDCDGSKSTSYGDQHLEETCEAPNSIPQKIQHGNVEVKDGPESLNLNMTIPGVESKHRGMDLPVRGPGCNLSHLNHYSEIAEKSIERFVSSLSSFRCGSSGSRASGLRPPLKDVKNTGVTRSNPFTDDFSRFAYVTCNRKTTSTAHLK
ncbi:exonuclease 1 isoform X2 [Amborella trichopoda]|uniref:exonuclease 1 isoform X2 n=1 Tax=Amborella trichopoda TaxID=13333 RepID=UPI0009C13D78|nr:exonuclease 1 isoform X2 [Amborella trichopoda]|eukprot:XP_020528471.1 exonuclease 1 isoform X2 [Amborella trichopoda]